MDEEQIETTIGTVGWDMVGLADQLLDYEYNVEFDHSFCKGDCLIIEEYFE